MWPENVALYSLARYLNTDMTLYILLLASKSLKDLKCWFCGVYIGGSVRWAGLKLGAPYSLSKLPLL